MNQKSAESAGLRRDNVNYNGDVIRQPSSRFPYGHSILIIGYMRAGSTFLADMIQNIGASSVFYSYEPLKYTVRGDYLDREEEHEYNHDEQTDTIKKFENYTEELDYLVNFYRCNLRRIRSRYLTSNKLKSSAARKYADCTKGKGDNCLDEAIQDCKQSARMIKEVRISMNVAADLLQRIPGLKVLHFLRDPRGMLRSWHRGTYLPSWEDPIFLKSVCDRMYRDSEIGTGLKNQYPQRFKAFLYEDIAEHTMEASMELLKFFGMTPGTNYEEWILRHTKSDSNRTILRNESAKIKFFSTAREDSAYTANFWRVAPLMKISTMEAIDKACAHAYTYLGLKPIDKDTIRNLTVPIRYLTNYLERVQP